MTVPTKQSLASSTAGQSPKPIGNCLLNFLPPEEYARLLPNLEFVHLPKGEVLYRAGADIDYCYFPLNGMISLVPITEAGDTVEISMIGCEGMVGIAVILQTTTAPYEVVVRSESDAVRIRAALLKAEFSNQDGQLQHLLLRYTHALFCEISQSAVCNRFHTVKQRLCRWLLVIDDRVRSHTFPLTHEFIANTLGIPRTNATMTLGTLRKAGLIEHRRGQITIIDRRGLKRAACECYRVVKKEIDSLCR